MATLWWTYQHDQVYKALQTAATRIGQAEYAAGHYTVKRNRKGQVTQGYTLSPEHQEVINTIDALTRNKISPEEAMAVLGGYDVEKARLRGPRAGEVRRQKHPGKFEGGLLIDEWLWQASLDGGPDEEVGEAERDSYYGLMAGGLHEPVERAAEEAGESLSLEERKFIEDNPAAIIFENSQGFVDVTWYESEAKARKEFSRIEAEIEAEEAEYGDEP